MNGVMNNTKWDELRMAMYGLAESRPRWRTKDVSGYLSPWDGDWFYHFRAGDYDSIEWVEIQIATPAQDEGVLELLRRIHLPGERVAQGFRIYGYVPDGARVNYI